MTLNIKSFFKRFSPSEAKQAGGEVRDHRIGSETVRKNDPSAPSVPLLHVIIQQIKTGKSFIKQKLIM